MSKVKTPFENKKTNNTRTIRIRRAGDSIKQTPIEKFKNPILGIEINLMREIQEISSNFHSTSYKKRNLLLNALEDLANSGTGFQDQILYASYKWNPSQQALNRSSDEAAEVNAVAELMKKQVEFRQVAQKHSEETLAVESLQKQIDTANEEISKYREGTKHFQSRLQNDSDHFASVRKLRDELISLQEDFEKIFSKEEKHEKNDEIAALEQENEELRQEIAKMKFELDITTQINRRITFLKQNIH